MTGNGSCVLKNHLNGMNSMNRTPLLLNFFLLPSVTVTSIREESDTLNGQQ